MLVDAVARFNTPSALAWAGPDELVVADRKNHAVRMIRLATKRVVTMAGNGESGDADGLLADARFQEPQAIAVGQWHPGLAGCVVAAKSAANIGTECSTDGDPADTAAAAHAECAAPPRPARVVYVADTLNNKIRVVVGDAVATLAGDGLAGLDDHAEGTCARFNNPRGIAVDPGGTVLVGDSGNHVIRRISEGGEVSTLAGSGQASTHTMAMRADGLGSKATFFWPRAICLHPGNNGYAFIADSFNENIRKVFFLARA